ncbi:hypothetical protein [Spirosoma linguale]|uniref:AraC family transcriptional regulator n=1 Tax=Spirosoma linguale (strain ATCC 33905 / DSM 74 / LMG 10896 / Claus 1) TaxID=504472 RepID=D2QI05_SPILD|nr:hypothetical protein Slin_0833 [Spirosoma linguale DSM 74]
MSNKHKIPTLTPADISRHHFLEGQTWLPVLGEDHQLFHINRLEEYRQYLKFPLPPHRKTVFDFIFLTKGHSTRSKGLESITFSANSFFFLPAYQITAHEWMSEDVEGYFCHFDASVLQEKYYRPDFRSDFSFLQFVGNPVVTTDESFVTEILPLFQKLIREYQRNQAFK